MLALLCACLASQDAKLKIEGPPFLALGESVEVRADAPPPPEATLVWRVADAPGGAAAALETVPSWDPRTFTVRGAPRLELRSVGRLEGEVLVTAAWEREGRRLATAEARLRLGRPLRVRAWCREVENRLGGTRRPERFRDPAERAALGAEVNRLLRPLGVEVGLEVGKAVPAPDGWFDREGRFRPVVLKDGKKDRSPTLEALLRHDAPGGLNIYLVRDCHWTEVERGFRKVVTEHSLVGIGLKDGEVVIDDSADAATLAHELGHALGLEDLDGPEERGRLMYSIRKHRTGSAFTYPEMRDARQSALRHLKNHARGAK
jgi:hypothetical protein